MESSNPCFFLFTLSLVLIANFPFLANADESNATLITEMCNEVARLSTIINNDSCLKVLQADPQIMAAKTTCDVANSTAHLAIKKALETQDFLKDLMKKDNSPYLQTCVQSYGSVIQVYKAIFEERDIVQVSFISCDMMYTSDHIKECEDQMKSEGIHNPDISSKNEEADWFITLVLAVSDGVRVKTCPPES